MTDEAIGFFKALSLWERVWVRVFGSVSSWRVTLTPNPSPEGRGELATGDGIAGFTLRKAVHRFNAVRL